jgi:hypothetical protein
VIFNTKKEPVKRIVLFIIVISIVHTVFCQQDNSDKKTSEPVAITIPATDTIIPAKIHRDIRPLKERIALGFGSSFWITPSQTYIELAPVIAYRFPKTFITGVGYKYIYRHERLVGRDLNAYGPNVFARVNLLKRVYFWTEYELLHNEYFTQISGQEIIRHNTTTDSWFAGLGYIRSIGRKGRGGVSIQILYNFLYDRDDYSPYYSPVTYRVGYYF